MTTLSDLEREARKILREYVLIDLRYWVAEYRDKNVNNLEGGRDFAHRRERLATLLQQLEMTKEGE